MIIESNKTKYLALPEYFSILMFYGSKKKTDQKSVSFETVPRTELFPEPFMKDLDLISRFEISSTQFDVKSILPKVGVKKCQKSE